MPIQQITENITLVESVNEAAQARATAEALLAESQNAAANARASAEALVSPTANANTIGRITLVTGLDLGQNLVASARVTEVAFLVEHIDRCGAKERASEIVLLSISERRP